MLPKFCLRLASAVIRAFQSQLLSINMTLNAIVRHQRKGSAFPLGPSTRWMAAAIASLIVIWLLWSLHGQPPRYSSTQREVHMAEKVDPAMLPTANPQFFSEPESIRSRPRPLPIVDHKGEPSFELVAPPPPGSLRLKTNTPPTIETDDNVERSDRPLILYAYAESENARANLEFFLKKGLHGKADFVFIFNGEAPEAMRLIPRKRSNVRVVQRDNTCYDIGSFGKVLKSQIKVGDEAEDGKGIPLWHRYKRFITMNASIRGPFLPMWSEECWTDAFLRKVTDDTKVSACDIVLNSDLTTRMLHQSPPSQLTLFPSSLSDYHITVILHHTSSPCFWPRITLVWIFC